MGKFIKLTNQSTNYKILLNTSRVNYIEYTDNGTTIYFDNLIEIDGIDPKEFTYFSITVSESFLTLERLLGED
ncbi:MAG: hypothetical protein IPJ39_09860 [Saprospiraceae bacterium]|nr:hypothetical protein [Saprospiraceae bacterium]